MFEVPIVAWIAAAVLAIVVFGFCGYEITWKARRLRDDLARLRAVTDRLQQVQRDLAATRERAARSSVRSTVG